MKYYRFIYLHKNNVPIYLFSISYKKKSLIGLEVTIFHVFFTIKWKYFQLENTYNLYDVIEYHQNYMLLHYAFIKTKSCPKLKYISVVVVVF